MDFGSLPESFDGVVFCNEFFDALPVDVAVFSSGAFHERRVTLGQSGFRWLDGASAPPGVEQFVRRWFLPPEEGRCYEAGLAAIEWLQRIARSLRRGYLFTIDYGYTRQESVRFPSGTLMGYRRHTALDDVLAGAGERDITAHVNFSMLQEAGEECGFTVERFETLARTILAAGERDQFASVLAGADASDELRRRMQLKTLLFGMGETFRVLLQRKNP